jgi:hypothetical protein
MAKIAPASKAGCLPVDIQGTPAISDFVTVVSLLADGGTAKPFLATNLNRKRKIKPTNGAGSP